MSRACQHKTESYEPKKVEAIYNNIVAKALTEKPQFYEIRVDGFTVVEKTSNPERFFDYSDFMDSGSKELAIFLFFGKGSDKYYFTLSGQAAHQELNGFSGNETKQESEDVVKERWRKDLHYEDLLEENEALKEEIEELRQSLELAEEEKDDIKSNRDISLKGVASILLNGLLNTDLAKEKLAFINNLSGTPPQAQEQTQTSQTENTFKRKSGARQEPEDVESEEVQSPKINKEEQEYIRLLGDIKNRVGLIEFKNVFHLLDLVTVHPQSIRFAIKQVTNYLKQSPSYQQSTQAGTKETGNQQATTTENQSYTQNLSPFKNTITEIPNNNTQQSESQTNEDNPIDLEDDPEF